MSFRTMSDRYDQLRHAYAVRRSEPVLTGLGAWLAHNRRVTDHASPMRAIVCHNGQLSRLTHWVT